MIGSPGQRVDEQVTEIATGAVRAAQRTAQLALRYRVHPADGAGQQSQRPVAGQLIGDAVHHRQQRAHGRMLGRRRGPGLLLHRNPGGGQSPGQRRPGARHRSHDDGHL